MAYPNAEDYVRAVQHPDRVFRLPALRSAAFELHPLFGIPMPASGNAAVVFKAGVGGEDAALRFFIREDASSRERYAALGRHFADSGIDDCVAHPTWIDDAISINGTTWPMVRMAWVDGRTLDAYVGHLAGTSNADALSYLAGTWRAFVGRLQEAEFAHGDLQHGNVLIDTSSALRLVDFDGSWIADFDGGPPPKETGHPNYQRTGREWGRWMDTFPGLVIYTALLALSRRPDSWAALHNGENMLFSAEDFDPPFSTPTWRLLSGIRDTEVDVAAERLMRACHPSWRAGDSLEALLRARPRVEIPQHRRPEGDDPFPGVTSSGERAASWWDLTGPVTGVTAPRGGPGTADGRGPAADAPWTAEGGTADASGTSGGSGVALGPAAPGPGMPPPPPKAQPGAAPPEPPSFAGTSPGSWYPRSGPGAAQGPWAQPGPRTPGGPAPRPGGGQGGGTPWLLVFAIAALAAIIMGGIADGAGANGGLVAVVSAALAAGVTLLAARRKP